MPLQSQQTTKMFNGIDIVTYIWFFSTSKYLFLIIHIVPIYNYFSRRLDYDIMYNHHGMVYNKAQP